MGEPTIHNYGGQVNYAKDDACIIASQTITDSQSEFERLSADILKDLPQLKEEDADTISDTISLLKEELAKQTPRTSRLRSAVTLLAPMVAAANGIPALMQNLQLLISHIQSLLP